MERQWNTENEKRAVRSIGIAPGRWIPLLFVPLSLFLFAGIGLAQENASAPLLAQRFAELSQSTLRQPRVSSADWHQAIALLEAAGRLAPQEAHYARLLVDARLRVGDTDGAIEALKGYRKLRPDDRTAQAQLIDLYVGRIETADAKRAYLHLLLNDQSLPPAVRSHVAVLAAGVEAAALRHDEMKRLIEQALQLNPLNMDALRLRYDQADTPAGRVTVLLAMLQSNPAQPWAAQTLAAQLADAGLTDLSTQWYARAAGLTGGWSQPMSAQFVADYAAELYIADQPKQTRVLAEKLLQAVKGDMDGLYLVMLSTRQAGDQAAVDQYARQAINGTLNRLAEARASVKGAKATTRPIDAPPPALDDLPRQAGEMKNAPKAAREAFISALGDLAWIELYFRQDADSAAHAIQALSQLLPKENVMLGRLEGWRLLVSGKKDPARQALSVVAQRDPLAALGMIRLEAGAPNAKTDAAKLLEENPSGLLGAFVWSGVRDLGVSRKESASGNEIRRRVEAFPRDWLEIVDRPRRFYHVRLEPVRVGHDYTDPLLARVTLRNTSDRDLTIGRDGVIHPDLWVDAQVRGLHQQTMPAVAYDQLSDRLVLRPGETVSRTLRVDQGALDDFLKQHPAEPVPVSATVILNPVLRNGGAAPGPGGQRADLDGIFQRNGFAINNEADWRRLETQLQSGTGAQKVRAASLVGTYVQMFRSDKATAEMKQMAGEMFQSLKKAAADNDTAAAAWASYLQARLTEEAQRWTLVRAMGENGAWSRRLLALVAVQSLPLQRQRELAGQLASDPDTIVQSYAAAMKESGAASRPATRP